MKELAVEMGEDAVVILPVDAEVEELERTRETRSLAGVKPGELLADGGWVDAEGYRHYPYGAKYKISPADKRLTANGAYSGPHSDVQILDKDEELPARMKMPPRVYQTLLLYLQGLSRRAIATELGISEQTVTTRLQHPAAKAEMRKQREYYTDDLHALTGMAIEVLHDAMDKNQDMKHRLNGAEKVLRANDRIGSNKPTAKEETATTQLQQVLNQLRVGRAEKIEINVRG